MRLTSFCRNGIGLAAALVVLCPPVTAATAVDRGGPALVGVVLDTSGSLHAADLARARMLTAELLDALPPGSEIAVFGFDDQPRLLLPRTADGEAVRKALEKLTISGRYTALYDALYDASGYLSEAPQARKAIVLITDGRDENSALELDDALKVAREAGFPVLAVGAGRVEEHVLRRIAKLTAGEYYPAAAVTGAAIGARVAAVPVAATRPPAAVSVPARALPAALTAAPPVSIGRTARWPWALVAVTAVAAAAGAILRRGRRSDTPPACATCGRRLPNPLAACAFCNGDTAVPRLAKRPLEVVNGGEVAQTVVQRMDLTEEYLEKTVTLHEEPVLAITGGPGSGQVFVVSRDGATSIGRAKLNEIVLGDVSVSSQHCRIRPDGGGFVLHDLRSTNGTFVNERRVARHALSEGDVVKCGETYLQFRLNQRRV